MQLNPVCNFSLTDSCSGGIDDLVHQVICQCEEQGLPIVFALSRRRLAYLLKKSHKVGCVGIFSYDGAEVSISLYRCC